MSQATGVDPGALRPFEHGSLSAFYTKAVCGRAHFGSPGRRDRGVTAVPMAFQSVLAGVLLAAEILAARCAIRTAAMPPQTKIDLMKRMGPFLKEPAAKHHSGRCICHDPVFVSAYCAKYAGRRMVADACAA